MKLTKTVTVGATQVILRNSTNRTEVMKKLYTRALVQARPEAVDDPAGMELVGTFIVVAAHIEHAAELPFNIPSPTDVEGVGAAYDAFVDDDSGLFAACLDALDTFDAPDVSDAVRKSPAHLTETERKDPNSNGRGENGSTTSAPVSKKQRSAGSKGKRVKSATSGLNAPTS